MKTYLSLTALFVLLFALFSTGVAYAANRTCLGTLGSITVDNLHVPRGAVCRLNGTRVRGDITVARNAVLYAENVIVNDDIEAEHARRVEITGSSRVGDDIDVEDSGVVRIIGATVRSDLQVEENTRRVTVNRNIVGGNLQVFQNTGGVIVRRNRVSGHLQCKSNLPAPTGGGNIVQGSKIGQCSGL